MSEINLNPNNKITGLANAALQHKKNDSPSEIKPNLQKPVNEAAFEITIGKGDNVSKLIYSREDLLQHITSTQGKDLPSTGEIIDNVTLNLEELLTQKTSPSDSTSPKQAAIPVPPIINASDLALLTAKDLNLTITLKIGDDNIEMGSNSTASFTGSFGLDNGQDTIVIGNNSIVNIDTHTDVDNSDDILIVGNNSEVYLSGHVGTDNSNDVLILGNNSKLHISGSTNIDNGNDTIILGNNSELWLSGSTGTDNGNDTFILGNNSKLIYQGTSQIDNGDTTFLIGNNVHLKLSINIDEDNKSSLLTFGNTDNLLNEMKYLRNRFKKFNIGNTNLEDILNDTLQRIKEALAAIQKNNINKGIKLERNSSDNTPWFDALELSIHRYFGQRLLAIDMIYNYAKENYNKYNNDNNIKIQSKSKIL